MRSSRLGECKEEIGGLLEHGLGQGMVGSLSLIGGGSPGFVQLDREWQLAIDDGSAPRIGLWRRSLGSL